MVIGRVSQPSQRRKGRVIREFQLPRSGTSLWRTKFFRGGFRNAGCKYKTGTKNRHVTAVTDAPT